MLWLRPCVLNGQPHPLTEDLSSRKAAISTSPSFWGFGNTASFLFRYRYQPLPTPFTGLYILIILYVLVSSLFFLNAPQIWSIATCFPSLTNHHLSRYASSVWVKAYWDRWEHSRFWRALLPLSFSAIIMLTQGFSRI